MRFNFIDVLKIEVGLSFEMSRPWRFFNGVTCHSNMSTNSGCVRHCHDRRTPPTHGEEEVPDEGPGHVVVGVHDGLAELLLCHHGSRALVDHALNLVPQVLDGVQIRT